jgi:hypothetical protein
MRLSTVHSISLTNESQSRRCHKNLEACSLQKTKAFCLQHPTLLDSEQLSSSSMMSGVFIWKLVTTNLSTIALAGHQIQMGTESGQSTIVTGTSLSGSLL